MTARTATLVRLAAIDVAAARPDGPLNRDLAAWITMPATGGLELGPLPLLAPPAIAADLDAEVDDAALATLAGDTVLVLELADRPGAMLVILGPIIPAA